MVRNTVDYYKYENMKMFSIFSNRMESKCELLLLNEDLETCQDGGSLTSSNNEKIFLQVFLRILKHPLQNSKKKLRNVSLVLNE